MVADKATTRDNRPMWLTPEGIRTLNGAEWELFRQGLCLSWDWIEDTFDDTGGWEFGVDAFDVLKPTQKLALLALVGTALKQESLPRPEATAHNEAAIAAIFNQIKTYVRLEIVAAVEGRPIDDPNSTRKLVLAAYLEGMNQAEAEAAAEQAFAELHGLSFGTKLVADADEDDDERAMDPPSPDCTDMEEWENVLDILVSRILWDDDYDMDPYFMDTEPDEGRRLRALMGIEDDYFTSLAPDPRDEELPAIREQLRALTGRPKRKP